MKKVYLIICALLIIAPFLFAAPAAVLEYFDDDFELEITDSTGEEIFDIYFGMELRAGDTIRTGRTSAELRLDPNGSIVKLSNNTVFTIESLQREETGSNNFNLVAGRVRTIAARSGRNEQYRISTPSAVAGVRGTDFVVSSIPGTEEQAFVLSGNIEYTNTETGESISLDAGMFADALAEFFQSQPLTQQQMQELLEDMIFQQLDPNNVPGYTPPEDPEEPLTEEEEPEDVEVVEAPTVEEPVTPEPPTVTTEELIEDPEDREEAMEAGILAALGEMVGLEIGTITIGNVVYSKAIIQPRFTIGDLRVALYLPIIYNTNLFDPDDWYQPRGNSEWSFGTDQDNTIDAVTDFMQDLFLKIRYIEYADQRDPFFFKFGNLNNMTIGHGILMNNYANDADFPAVRRLGLNLGADRGGWGFEAVVNDMGQPNIFGGRFYIRPFGGKLALGVSSVIDRAPFVTAEDPEAEGPAFFISGAFDLDLPIIETDLLSFILFADIGGMVPYIDGDLHLNALYDSDAPSFSEGFRNYGFASGVFGNILFVDYRLEYRQYDGVFRPAFFDTTYERMRAVRAEQIREQIADNFESDKKVMGIYGSAGFELFDFLRMEAGYMWPWVPGENLMAEDDEVHIKLEIPRGTIPVVDIHGSVAYRRSKFIPTLIGNAGEAGQEGWAKLSLFDANTTVSGEIIYPIAPTLDLVGVFSTAIRYKEGQVVYKDGIPQVDPNITIETRLSF